ncbi:RNA polymerase sigma factor [Granulicella cerasi]|uniref:RNA polymerase sigma factor n=1 Tax=Granulicella cerasi TaxID=741063 RepID=A0ABW1ZBG5_9BACT|nr:sigma-70 family RNA polymerase sigma factor [Granulicella cerasi]
MSLFAGTTSFQPTNEDTVMALYDQTRPALLIYLAGLGLAVPEAEDAIHDAFIRLYEHLQAKNANENLRGWLFRVCHNRAMDLFREARRIQPDTEVISVFDLLIDASLSPEEQAIRTQEIQQVTVALGKLTPQQRAAVLLRAEDLRYREIAEVMGVSIKRVSELVHRALALLAGSL